MNNKPMTATEVQFRMEEARKRAPTPDFSSAVHIMARKMKRAILLAALQGSREDRLRYCLERATSKPMIDFACYGTAVYDPDKISELVFRWFFRLERLSDRWVKV